MRGQKKDRNTGQDQLASIYLRTGLILLDYSPPIGAELKELWKHLGPGVMKSHRGAPGARPWGFWKHEGFTRREFQPGKLLPLDQGGCFLAREQLRFSDSGSISPGTPEFQTLAYSTYDPHHTPSLEDDLAVLARLGLATAAELKIFEGRKQAALLPTTKPVPGKLVLQLRERQARDLANTDWLYRFDEAAAARPVEFAKLLRHSKGRWAGQPFVLAPWQEFDVIRILFGWLRRSDGLRRFDTAYNEVARKNGKSTLASSVGNYFLLGDREQGAGVFAAATKGDQANLVHGESCRQLKSSPELHGFVKLTRNKINVARTNSQFTSLASDADSLDGLNISAAIIDELHAHPSRSLYDVLDTATGSRSQPMLFSITTAGWNRNTVCFEKHEYAKSILQRSVEDETFFAYIAALDDKDEWTDPKNFHKANPGLGLTLTEDSLLTQLKRAQATLGFQDAFRQDRLNQWTSPVGRAFSMDLWRACGGSVNEADLIGKTCFAGVDISAVSDFTALVLLFPSKNSDGKLTIKVLPRFWLPENTMRERARKDRMPYPQWVDQGLLRLTPGSAIDQDFVLEEILKCAQDFKLQQIAFDPWGARTLSERVTAALGRDRAVLVPPHFRFLSEPIKEMFRMVLDHRLEHGDNPIMTWMAGNLCVTFDVHQNYRLDKDKSIEKIDGISAMVVALSRLLDQPVKHKSVYATRGLLTV